MELQNEWYKKDQGNAFENSSALTPIRAWIHGRNWQE